MWREAHGRSRSLACRERHRRRLRRNMGAPLHSHFSSAMTRCVSGGSFFFSRTGQAFYSFASFVSFFSLFSLFFFFFFWNATAYFAQFAIRGYAPDHGSL